MPITATQYLGIGTVHTSTVTATVGAYVVPTGTRGQVVAVTCANSGVNNRTGYVTVQLYNGATAFHVSGVGVPVPPGGSFIAVGAEKHILGTGGSVYVTAYATNITSYLSIIELATT